MCPLVKDQGFSPVVIGWIFLLQRDEESCPAPAYACTCTSDAPGRPGDTGPPVSYNLFRNIRSV